jgi:hypothetical protein
VSTEKHNNKLPPTEIVEETKGVKENADQPGRSVEESEKNYSNNADAQIQAHRQQHQKRLKKLFGGSGTIVVIMLVIFAAYQFYSESNSVKPENAETQVISELSSTQIEAYREQFKDALTQYEISVQPNIDLILLTNWETTKVTELALLKERGLTAFAQGAFLQAKRHFETLYTQSNELIAKWELQTSQHIESARTAFSKDQIPQAQLSLNKALALMPTNLEALALQNRIDAYGEVEALLSDLKVAKIENNLPKQIDLLKNIIQLDPHRSELNQDLATVKISYNQQKLAALLEDAEKALLANQLGKAKQLVDAAKIIEPGSKGVQSLNSRIAQATAQQSLTSNKALIDEAVKQDNWEGVAQLSNAALQRFPADAQLKDYQSKAQQILSAKKSLAFFIARPERLADDNIREAATTAIQNAFAPSLMSPSLQQLIEQAANAVDKYKSPVDITIQSDGKTYIIVLGVGHVGEQKEKVISLTPGNYILQGKREGYRNKRLEFTVRGNTPLTLSIICDQKI